MVHIIEHRDVVVGDFLMEEEAASSAPLSSSRLALAAAAVRSTRQHTPTQASRTPSRVAPTEVLSAARELLRHPPSPTASPGAIK
jgi:hypothetical protein